MRRSIPIILAVVLAACRVPAPPASVTSATRTGELDAEERAVLAAAIDSLVGTARTFVLVADRTDGSDLDAGALRWAAREAGVPGELVPGMWRDFARRNA
ncbi:MAG: hypothetical protein JO306_11440, partial [Gemmatimonadetes bacterium]|nr:hypothetical protein [Gemmatimonadota bacterium]